MIRDGRDDETGLLAEIDAIRYGDPDVIPECWKDPQLQEPIGESLLTYTDEELRAANARDRKHDSKRGRPPKHVGCKMDGCDRKHKGFGYCARHLEQIRRRERKRYRWRSEQLE